MTTKDDQEGRVKNAILPTTPHTTAETAGSGAAETRGGDDSWKQNFPDAAAANASREAYQQTADERRIQAEKAVAKEQARQAAVNNDPVPTGESDNPHSEEPATDPDADTTRNPDVDSPPDREPPQQ